MLKCTVSRQIPATEMTVDNKKNCCTTNYSISK